MTDTLKNVLMSVLAVGAVVGFGCALVTILHRSMARLTRSMNRQRGGLAVHPYMEMVPGKDRPAGGRGTDEEMILPGADLSRVEKEDPRRA